MVQSTSQVVDVVVPVLNGGRRFEECLLALRAQEGVRHRILVADNGSTDGTRSLAETYAHLTVHEPVRSSYAARNRAVREVVADVVAFTDADCVAEPDWLAKGLETLEKGGWDLVAGRVAFDAPRTAAGRHDALTYLDQKANVQRGFAATANLFVRRGVLESLRGFDQDLASGGDLEFCRRAVASGFRLGYAEDAVVRHPPRESLREVLKKAWRIGLGHGALAVADDAARRRWWSVRSLRPARTVLEAGDALVVAVELAVRMTTYLARRVGHARARRRRHAGSS